MADYKLTGECGRCRDCCSYPVIPLKYATAKTEDGYCCEFLRKELDGTYTCRLLEKLILSGEDVSIATDRIDEIKVTEDMKSALNMSDEHIHFCCKNMDFPNNPHGIRTIQAGMMPNCSFKVVEN